jgi:CRP-like cAMP-binding protein
MALSDEPKTKLPVNGSDQQAKRGIATAEDIMALLDKETDLVAMKPGQVLFRKGEVGHQMYIVKSGEVQIVDSNHVLETVRPGGILGEMALVDGGPRSATAPSFGHSAVIPIDAHGSCFSFSTRHSLQSA